MGEPFYITTAISYPNGKPHIGHAYEAIAADVIARFQRAMGRDVRFQTGTDEHGLKMMQKARELGTTPKQLCDEMSSFFIQMCDALNVSYDVFIRTTEDRHHTASQELWRRLEANGDLYLDRYEGWYSVRDEAFYDESELIAGEGGEKLSPQGTPVEWTVEESWFFRLSKYAEPLLKLYEGNPGFIQPDGRRNEVLRFVEGGLRDLSVSRTSFDWGVKVPGSDGHVMYVWVDALTNYLTGLGFPDEAGDFAKYWPANIHLIGKDIVRFHAVYWPALLMSAGLAPPKQVFGHGFLLNRGQKESKTVGNVTDPLELAERFGVDPLRYFLMREIAFGQDGSYSPEAIVTRCNAELANSYGNLVQRVLSMIFKNMDGSVETFASTGADDVLLATVFAACRDELPREFAAMNFSGGIDAWMRGVFACNAYVDEQAPWTLRKTDPERMRAVLLTLFMAIRDLTIAISPIVPHSAAKVLDQLGIPLGERDFAALTNADWYMARVATGEKLGQPMPAFPRLELPEEATAA
ncbi:MAG: methionine--tRNA ligase [Novosphingobium sp. 32-60-15]|uniref:methionine--tRNA ligase n=1 Tax=unclassified Novosphingobium TaxID=2644732 RepID=UPI000BC65267|nr:MULTISPECIES: methionine--tRNA ligase [unclassified Novosphingobium]OYX60125.1 MAG: methionine--tRNA ligase [Novosphingobium sp. 32-60-15]